MGRRGENEARARRRQDLADLGYLEYDSEDSEQRLWLTVEGIHLLNITEDALLVALEDVAPAEEPASTG